MSDLTFWVWLYTCLGALVLAFASALYLSSTTETPTGRHRAGAPRPVRVELEGLRAPAYYRRTPEPFPVTTPKPSPAPVHLPAPEPEPERIAPADPTRQQIEAEYRPITGRVVPLWDKTEERRRQVRLRALAAVAEGLPDLEYTFEGAHSLGAVA